MVKTTFSLLLFILVAISSISNAQDLAGNYKITKSNATLTGFDEETAKKEKRPATSYKNNLSLHLGLFDPWLGVSYERLITPFWGFDAALGLIGGSIGTKVYFPRLANGKTSVYTGISEGVLLLVGPKHYIPIGITHLGKEGFKISLDVGPQIYYDSSEPIQFGLSLRVGKSF